MLSIFVAALVLTKALPASQEDLLGKVDPAKAKVAATALFSATYPGEAVPSTIDVAQHEVSPYIVVAKLGLDASLAFLKIDGKPYLWLANPSQPEGLSDLSDSELVEKARDWLSLMGYPYEADMKVMRKQSVGGKPRSVLNGTWKYGPYTTDPNQGLGFVIVLNSGNGLPAEIGLKRRPEAPDLQVKLMGTPKAADLLAVAICSKHRDKQLRVVDVPKLYVHGIDYANSEKLASKLVYCQTFADANGVRTSNVAPRWVSCSIDASTGQVVDFNESGNPSGKGSATAKLSWPKPDAGAIITLKGKTLRFKAGSIAELPVGLKCAPDKQLILQLGDQYQYLYYNTKEKVVWLEGDGYRLYGKPNSELTRLLRKL